MASPNPESPSRDPDARTVRTGPIDAGERRRRALLTVALFGALGALFLWLGSFDHETVVGPVVFRETSPDRDEPWSIHLAATLLGSDRSRLRLDAVLSRAPITVDFERSRIQFPGGRQVSFPRGGNVTLVDASGSIRRRTLEPGGADRRWVVDLFTRDFVGSPDPEEGSDQYRSPATFAEVREGFARIAPQLEAFWTDS